MSRNAKLMILMIPLGAIAGFICAFVILLVTGFFHLIAGRLLPYEVPHLLLYAIVAGIMPGANVGMIFTPVAYGIFFRDLDNNILRNVILIIGLTTIVAGGIGGIAQDFVALIFAVIGFCTGVLAAFAYSKDHAVRSGDST